MEERMNYVIGLDIGIGSVGWAAVNLDKLRIEDFGVRLFDSGEDLRKKERKSQQRRGFRATRRLVRRRAHRVVRLKQLFEKIGLVSLDSLDRYYENPSAHPLELRARGLSEQLSPAEVAAALLHIAKHRGYNEFYQLDDEEKKTLSKEEKEDLSRAEAYNNLMKNMPAGFTPAQLYLSHPLFMSEYGVRYRNTKKQDESKKVLIPRAAMEAEARRICEKQAQFYPCLTAENREKIYEILFRQRDFEEGPGDPTDETRPYKGFHDTIGNCRFYPDEKRGARFTVLGDLFVLVNRLSQNRYFNSETGELIDSADAFREIAETALCSGEMDFNGIKKILKQYGIEMLNTNEKADSPNQCIAFTRMIKPILIKHGMDWETVIHGEFPFAAYREDSFLNTVGRILSENRTPQRRVDLLRKAGVSPEIAKELAMRKTNGTVSVSNRYMREAVEAFLDGELFGDFNARREKELQKQTKAQKKYRKLPPIEDGEYTDNPVVFRSINETRKIINAIVEKYGSPNAINIEIAAEVSRTFEERDRMRRENDKNKAENDRLKKQIAALLQTAEEITPVQVERYRLGEQQGWKCPYCGQPIAMETAIKRDDRSYEIDHIIPYSLILDNTQNNKVLVHHGCNQAKGQRTPLMYLSGDPAKKAELIKWTNAAYGKKQISKRKREYLLQPDLNDARMQEWKTRNLNDTRYIAKYLVRYLNENLLFHSEEKTNVHAVKGAITSQLRRVWLNKDTWGGDDKSELRTTTNLHHAVDAVVIANCMPGYVELAEEALRLQRMYYEEGKRETEKWTAVLNSAAERLYRYYRMPKAYTETMLRNVRRVPSLIPELRGEVDLRFCDCDLANETAYRAKLCAFYSDDLRFASSIRMPLVSYKPNRKATGKITAENALKKEKAEGLLVKQIGENNETVLDDASYYCTEVYRRKDGTLGLRGVRYSMLKRERGKIVLNESLPEDYAAHVTYLFKNDYIRIYDKDNIVKFEGYYLSVFSMKAQRIYTADRIKGRNEKSVGILKNERVEKLDVSILGDLGGLVACGKPFLSETNRS